MGAQELREVEAHRAPIYRLATWALTGQRSWRMEPFGASSFQAVPRIRVLLMAHGSERGRFQFVMARAENLTKPAISSAAECSKTQQERNKTQQAGASFPATSICTACTYAVQYVHIYLKADHAKGCRLHQS